MSNYITIDGGTTNTRVALVMAGTVRDTRKISLGNKDCVDGNGPFKTAIRDAICDILPANSLCVRDIEAVIASGMITSEYGLMEVPHITAPAGIKELHDSMAEGSFPEICPLPFWFIPGIKTGSGKLAEADIMRGEETEIMGLYREDFADYAWVLPGSHSKHIFLDSEGRISKFRTMMTGEMISAIAQNTILKGTVRLDLEGFHSPFLVMGCDYCLENGINNALFKTRILKNVFGRSDIEVYSYFLGAVLAQEIEALKNCGAKGVVLGGRSQIKNAMAYILKTGTDMDVVSADDESVDSCVPLGAVRIFEYGR